jgi:hypothetical protein
LKRREKGSAMSDTDDQSAQQFRGAGGTTAAGTQGASQADTERGYVPRQAPGYDNVSARDDGPSGAAIGGTLLAAALMMITGVLGFFEGLAAIIKGTFFVVLPNYAFSLSAVAWGWWRLIIGVIVFAAGVALLTDRTWARILAVVIASINIIANFVALPYYPVWAVVVIALSAFVIWAVLTPRNRRI